MVYSKLIIQQLQRQCQIRSTQLIKTTQHSGYGAVPRLHKMPQEDGPEMADKTGQLVFDYDSNPVTAHARGYHCNNVANRKL